MPELTRQFGGGAMNKDLDERLVPNGQYRDALNVQVSSSEASDVGTVQNILGNRRPYGSALSNLGANPECVGVFVQPKTEMIYWFIASDTKSIIFEYDQTLNTVSPILVDTQNILKFSTKFKITGINIIDNLLFWTDNKTEPKKINIDKWKTYNTSNSSYTHTQISSSNFIEDDITMIKKSPIKPPTLTMSASKRTGVVETTLIQKAFTETSGDFDPIDTGNYGNVTFTINPNFEVGDKLKVTLLDGSNDQEVILSVTAVLGSLFTVNVDVVSESIEEGLQDWKVELIEEKAMFEFKFPQFAYRYKYDDNEYSAIGPWSEVAFLPDPFDYNPKKGYNKGMVNTLRSLKIGGFTESAPNGVKEIDILYKESANNNIYTVQSIKKADDEYTAGTNGEVEITSDVIYKVLPAIQALRPWDNVPRKAKAQAMSANRIMYGNYIENFNMLDSADNEISVKFNVSIIQNPNIAVQTKVPKPSIKSLRTYQVGVVYRDKYGRETPVFTDPSGSFILDKPASINYNVIQVSITSPIPEWAESYKYFIKESSDEYYNLAMDRHYPAEDGNAWIAFPSAERNKVSEESFLVLKKKHDSDTFVDEPARYKIIAISNEAPPFLKIERSTKGVLQSSNSGATTESIFLSTGYPLADTTIVHITQAKWKKIFGGNDNDHAINVIPVHQLSDLVCRVKGSGNQTKWYDIANIKLDTTGTDYYEVELEDKFDADDVSFVPATHSASDTTLAFEIAQKKTKSEPEYAGRFFAKLERDATLEDAILSNQNSNDYKIKGATYTYALTGKSATKSYWRDTEKGLYPGGTDNSKNKHAEWYLCRNNYNKFKWAGGAGDNINNGVKERMGLGGVTNESTAKSIQGFGAQAGNDYMEIAYHRWGDNNNQAWTDYWNKFTSVHRPGFKNIVNAMETVKTKFRFKDDPEQTIYTIKGWSKSYIVAFEKWAVEDGKWGSMRVIKWTLKLDKELQWTPEDNSKTTKATATRIEFLDVYADGDEKGFTSDNPAIFETEPKDVADLNLYYEAGEAYNKSVHGGSQLLDYSNCFSFGNGVESDRIRDDYNAAKMLKGVKANTILEQPYAEERQSNKVIFSGLYNSTSGTNNTNQFIQADDITKSINPVYGSIQLMRHRHGGLDVLCEDKCFKIPTEKDMLFTADGSKQVTVSSKVLGTPNPYTGEFGISKNPESYATYGYRAYFSDKARGAILRLSNDGLEPISRYGMEDYFKDNLAASTTIVGSYDTSKKEYNVTLNHDTVSFKENTNAWVSRKSYLQEAGISLNNLYYTFKDGQLWSHDNETRNNFYGAQNNSSVKLVFNDLPSSVKQFKTLNYEGTRSRIFVDNDTNNDGYSNLDTDNYFPGRVERAGWWSNSIESNKQSGQVISFEEKEGKWFNFIQGIETTLANLDTEEFSVQGLGTASSVTASEDYSYKVTITVNENAD